MVRTALERLGISQTELAKGTGYCLDWVNTLVRARKHIGSDAEIRLRAFVQQLAEGREPTPLTNEQLRPTIPGPLDVPLSSQAVNALGRSSFGTAELRVLVECLRGCEITQITLAEWWGYPYKAVRNMSSGERRIPAKAAERLREIFAIEPAQNGGAE
jgi:plasmid maintenance system antidote protein VapI